MLIADCWFSELGTIKNRPKHVDLVQKRTSSSSHCNVACSCHDIAEKNVLVALNSIFKYGCSRFVS